MLGMEGYQWRDKNQYIGHILVIKFTRHTKRMSLGDKMGRG